MTLKRPYALWSGVVGLILVTNPDLSRAAGMGGGTPPPPPAPPNINQQFNGPGNAAGRGQIMLNQKPGDENFDDLYNISDPLVAALGDERLRETIRTLTSQRANWERAEMLEAIGALVEAQKAEEEKKRAERKKKLEEEARASLAEAEKKWAALKEQERQQALQREGAQLEQTIKDNEAKMARLDKEATALRNAVEPLQRAVNAALAKLPGVMDIYRSLLNKHSAQLQQLAYSNPTAYRQARQALNAKAYQIIQDTAAAAGGTQLAAVSAKLAKVEEARGTLMVGIDKASRRLEQLRTGKKT